jgi:NAD(P)-dependent dehydrogenase (short-subunit alcohol dehydrogenase family)
MKTILLIGASRGIGFELASQYIADGWRVIATARSDEGLERLKALGAQTLRLDVANPASNSGLSWQLDGEKIDLAIYVAGVVDRETTASPPTREKFDLLMHTNAMGPMMVLPQIAPMLLEKKGVFAVISSHFGRCAQHDFPEISCVALHPGWVQTDMGGASAPLTPEQSVSSMRKTLERIRTQPCPENRGAFLNHDGQALPW